MQMSQWLTYSKHCYEISINIHSKDNFFLELEQFDDNFFMLKSLGSVLFF